MDRDVFIGTNSAEKYRCDYIPHGCFICDSVNAMTSAPQTSSPTASTYTLLFSFHTFYRSDPHIASSHPSLAPFFFRSTTLLTLIFIPALALVLILSRFTPFFPPFISHVTLGSFLTFPSQLIPFSHFISLITLNSTLTFVAFECFTMLLRASFTIK